MYITTSLSGPLDQPSDFKVNQLNATFIQLFWGAPFSLDVTDYSPSIFYYTLCINVTIFKTIIHVPNCSYSSTCSSLVNLADLSINGNQDMFVANDNPTAFTLSAVNGAGNGKAADATCKYEYTAHVSTQVGCATF